MVDIQGKLVKWDKRNAVSRRLHAKSDKETIVSWKLDLGKILRVFNVRSVIRAETGANFQISEGT